MTEILIFGAIGILLLATLLWLLWPRAEAPGVSSLEQLVNSPDFVSLHCRYYAELKQVFSARDVDFMRRRASPALFRTWTLERRRIINGYVKGLRTDFECLTGLARSVAALAPEVSIAREGELLGLGIRFGLLYQVTKLRLVANRAVLPQAAGLADMVGGLAASVERAISQATRVPERSASGLIG